MTDLNEVRSIRTADDSWAITESVGATALGVAALRAAETAQPDPLIRDEFALMLVSGAGAAWNQLAGSDLAWLRDDADARVAHEVARDYQAVRTHYFDGFFADAVRSGIRQVVILAAGLDARAYRIDWPAGTVVFEIDQPKVLDYKAATLAAHGAVPTARRVAVPVDLRHDWPAVLTAAGFDPAQPTAWLAEGLLPYLPADAQDRLFELVTANSAAGSRIAVEAFTVDPAWNSAPQRAARRDRAERMRARLDLDIDIDIDSLVYTDEQRADAAEWLAGHGWTVHAVPSVTEMTRLGRPAAGDLGSYGMDSVLLRADRTGGDQ